MRRDDIEFIREYAKCGIHHNWMHKEDKLNEKIDRLNLISSKLYDIINNFDSKDKEIERLKEKSLFIATERDKWMLDCQYINKDREELREALKWAKGALQGYNYPEDFIEKCRKLIGE